MGALSSTRQHAVVLRQFDWASFFFQQIHGRRWEGCAAKTLWLKASSATAIIYFAINSISTSSQMMQERGVFVDHSSIDQWTIKFLPLLEKNVSPQIQTTSGRKLADGRNPHQGEGPMEIPLSCRETNHETDARIQVFPVSQKCSGGYRTHAHDTQRADEKRRRTSHVRSQPVL